MRTYATLRQPALIFLAIGAVIGLVLGLLIGWVFWPVQWTGATLRDLYPPEKAEYIAAVADAFVIYDSPEAAEVALRRLTAIDDGNLPQSFQDSLTYFATSPYSDKAIRDSNIRRLAVALNMAPPTMATAPQALTTSGEVAPTSAAPLITPVAATEETSVSLGWVGWLLWLVTALLLLVGGMYILRKAGLPDLQALLKARMQSTQKNTDDEIDEFEEPTTSQRRGQSNVRKITPQAASPADYSFEQEEDEEWEETGKRSTRYATMSEISNRYQDDDGFGKDDFREDDFAEDDFTEDDYLEDDSDTPFDDDDEGNWRPPGKSSGKSYTIDVAQEENPPRPPSASPYAPPSAPAETHNRAQGADIEPDLSPNDDRAPKAALSTATTLATRPTTPATRRPNTKSLDRPSITRARTKMIDQHVFHYQMGMQEYDESRPIVDPQSGKYIGEFGMGASDKNAMMQIGPHQLVALEVWIFDKSDERNLGNRTRILLSEYAIDHNLEHLFLKERQDNPRPFTAQPGVHFQLESQNLLLDCTIIDVLYSSSNATKGIFQEITVDMSVQQKG